MSSSELTGAEQPGSVIISGTKFGSEVANYSEGRKPYPMDIFPWIRGMLSQDANVLDMACGSGKATVDLRKHVTTHVTGFDINRQMLEVEVKDFPVQEVYTFQQACARVKSVGFFAELDASDKKRAWPALEAAVKEKFVSGIDVPLRIERVVRCFVYKSV